MLPGAAIGDGPVIRVGDASLTFDAEAEAVLLRAREEIVERRPDFKAQRQLMSGGTWRPAPLDTTDTGPQASRFPWATITTLGPTEQSPRNTSTSTICSEEWS